jgi:hypothetical protein
MVAFAADDAVVLMAMGGVVLIAVVVMGTKGLARFDVNVANEDRD